jgi:hypothetical protein
MLEVGHLPPPRPLSVSVHTSTAAPAAAAAVTHGIIFRQLFDAASSTYTYLVACPDTQQAALIDPVLEQVGSSMPRMPQLGLL